MILATAEDPQTAADFALCDIEDAIAALHRMPGESLADFAERIADRADDLINLAQGSNQ